MFTVAEVAAHLAVSDEAVLALIRSGRLKSVNVGLGVKRPRHRITQQALEEFIQSRTASAKPISRRRKTAAVAATEFF
jgi:excisionase family DNA binding protein